MNALRIVLIDDNPDDRALVAREFSRAFEQPVFDQVKDQAGFEKLAQGPAPSLVVTDFQLRWSDGLAILRRIKQIWPDCPVIMFTGTGSEEVAVEAMKAGLDDYVLKSPRHYSRLSSAGQVSLRLSQQRRQIKEVEGRYSSLFDSVPVGLYRATPGGRILDANPCLVEMLGYPNREALLAAKATDLYVHAEDYQTWSQLMNRQGVVRNFETELRCQCGKPCWVRESARAVRDAKGEIMYYEGSLEDITESKKAEEEREKLIIELQDALAKIKTLSGLLPICSSCKKIRDDKGYWNQIEVYIETHSDAEFTHSFCPDCMQKLYPEIAEVLSK